MGFQMSNSGFFYGLTKGQETDLMVHDSMPDKPLICSIYLGQSSRSSLGLSGLRDLFFGKSNTKKLKIPDQTLAARELRLAKTLLKKGHIDSAVSSLKEIVKKYPETTAATESQLILTKQGNGA